MNPVTVQRGLEQWLDRPNLRHGTTSFDIGAGKRGLRAATHRMRRHQDEHTGVDAAVCSGKPALCVEGQWIAR